MGRHTYEYYGVYPARSNDVPDDTFNGAFIELQDFHKIDAPGNLRALQRVTGRLGGAAFLIGPTDAPLVPVRLPEGLTARQAQIAIQDQLVNQDTWGQWPDQVSRAGSILAARIGAGWFTSALAYTPADSAGNTGGHIGGAQPLVFVALYDNNPAVPLMWDRLVKTPGKQVQVWLSVNGLLVAGVLAVLFLGALVASPVAFLYERRQTEEQDLARERERVRREARERVVGRLTHLSERVDAAAAMASASTRREVAGVAHDIDSTVDELRLILGELSKRGGDRDE
ncbi:MAG: hypothetical protein CVT67_08855 [Actinobacteria bacterium HGW-Actinobacteria-7]|nr:MAG: hypothetical protein CVT67_08855 [Actinobacteria bacterium HGW-Actinobacteria-7]